MSRRILFAPFAILALATLVAAAEIPLATQLRELDSQVIVRGVPRVPPLAGMLARDVDARLKAANRADRLAWEQVETRADWERFRDQRIALLRSSLGNFPAPQKTTVCVTGRHKGDGYEVENILYPTRSDVVVTANLYRPLAAHGDGKAKAARPAILICHSHQSTKQSGWRQDMAMTWARAGCVVLVPDHLGHGERKQHPFPEDAPHNYHFRFDTGLQLQLIGESLMGWLVWDLMRGVDVLVSQADVDRQRVLLISEPAGGGDVAAVAAALDSRITAAMVQNFGGPEPENPYPLPKHSDETFDFVGAGTWESTRNLRLSARDGFLPWTIVAAIAPRRMIYDHEFYWDREHDPVWRRLQRVWKFYETSDSLVGIGGQGFVVGNPPENTHWLPINRELIYPTLERWFQIPNPKTEFHQPRPETELLSLTDSAPPYLRPRPLHAITADIARDRLATARKRRNGLSPDQRRADLRREWTKLLGDIEPPAAPIVRGLPEAPRRLKHVSIERIHLAIEPGIVVPMLLAIPDASNKRPVVVAVSQHGKQSFLRERTDSIVELLEAGVAVALPDVRGTGETSPGDTRGRRGAETDLAASEWMLGQSLLGGRLRDLRSVLRYLRLRDDLDVQRISLWGDSFAAANSPDTNIEQPYSVANRPPQAEPLGSLLVLFGALFEDDLRAVYSRGGLRSFASILESPFCYVPQDTIVPGALQVSDLEDVASASTTRRKLHCEQVDGRNRAVPDNAPTTTVSRWFIEVNK